LKGKRRTGGAEKKVVFEPKRVGRKSDCLLVGKVETSYNRKRKRLSAGNYRNLNWMKEKGPRSGLTLGL